MISLPLPIEVVSAIEIMVKPLMTETINGPPLWKFTAAQLQRDFHVIGEDVVEVLHSSVQWVPSRFSF